MSKMAIEINVRIVSMLHAYVENGRHNSYAYSVFIADLAVLLGVNLRITNYIASKLNLTNAKSEKREL